MSNSLRHGMSVEAIPKAEGTTVGAVNMLLSRALKKLRTGGLLCTARELAQELDRNRKGVVERHSSFLTILGIR